MKFGTTNPVENLCILIKGLFHTYDLRIQVEKDEESLIKGRMHSSEHQRHNPTPHPVLEVVP